MPKKEDVTAPLFRHIPGSIAKYSGSKTSPPKTISDTPFPVSARYANSQQWIVPVTNDREIELLYFRVVKDMIAREGAVLKLRAVLNNMETRYWKYAYLRVQAADKRLRKGIKEEEIKSKRMQIQKLQAEATVAIAHVRGASVAVLESIIAWRNQLSQSKSIKTKETVSMYWGKTNYLHKMCTDVIEACECSTMRLWLGFEANPLMLPPQYAGQGTTQGPGQGQLSPPRHQDSFHHSPSATFASSTFSSSHRHHPFDAKNVWEKEHLEHFAVWLTKRTAWITKLEKAQRIEMKRRRGELLKTAAEQRAELLSTKSSNALGGALVSPTKDDDEEKEKEERREQRMSLGLIMKMKHMSKGIQNAIAKRVEEEKADAELRLRRPSVEGKGRRPSYEIKDKTEEVHVVTSPSPQVQPPPRRDRSTVSSLDPQQFAEKISGGDGTTETHNPISISAVLNSVQFSGGGGGGAREKRQGLTLDQRLTSPPADGGGSGGGGILSTVASSVAAAAASTVSSLMMQTSLPFVLAPPVMETEFHVGPDKIILINGEDKLSSWLHVRNHCAMAWNPSMPVTFISEEENEKSVQEMEQTILNNSQIGKVRSASTQPGFAIDVEKLKKSIDDTHKKKKEKAMWGQVHKSIEEGGKGGGQDGFSSSTHRGETKMNAGASQSGGGVSGSPLKTGITTATTPTTPLTRATTVGVTGGQFSPSLSLLSTDDMSVSSSVVYSFKPTPLQGMKAAPKFWSKLNQNPVAVEASIGLRELYPITPIVPPLPSALRVQCMALESLLIEEQQIYAELETQAKQGKQLRQIIHESVTEEGLMGLAESSLMDGWTTNSRGTTASRENMYDMLESKNLGRDDNSRGGNTIGNNTLGSNTIGSNSENAMLGVFSQQRELLKSRQRFAADLTEGSGVIHSPTASASTLAPYLLYGKPKQSRFSALKALREREERQKNYIKKLDAQHIAEARSFALKGLSISQKIATSIEKGYLFGNDEESSQWSAQLPSPSIRSILTSPPRAERQGLDNKSNMTMGSMNASYDSYTLHINPEYVQKTLENRIHQARLVVNKNPLVDSSQSEVRTDTRGRRGLDPTSVYWQNLCATLIQRLVRIFLAKRILKRKKAAFIRMRSIIIVQRMLRGAIGRKQYRDAKNVFRKSMHILRHHVLNRHEAAKIIVQALRRYIDRKRWEKSQQKSIHDVFRERKEQEAETKRQEIIEKAKQMEIKIMQEQTLSSSLRSYDPRLTDDTRPISLRQREVVTSMLSTESKEEKEHRKEFEQGEEVGFDLDSITSTNSSQAIAHTFPALRPSSKKVHRTLNKEDPHSEPRTGEGMSSSSSHKSSSLLLNVIATKVSFKDAEFLANSQQSQRLADATMVIECIQEDHPSMEINQSVHPNDDVKDEDEQEKVLYKNVHEDVCEGMVEGNDNTYEPNVMTMRPATTGSSSHRLSTPSNNDDNNNNNNNNSNSNSNNQNNETNDNHQHQRFSMDSSLNSNSFRHHLQSTNSTTTIPTLHHETSFSSRAQTAQGLGPARTPSKKSIDNTVRRSRLLPAKRFPPPPKDDEETTNTDGTTTSPLPVPFRRNFSVPKKERAFLNEQAAVGYVPTTIVHMSDVYQSPAIGLKHHSMTMHSHTHWELGPNRHKGNHHHQFNGNGPVGTGLGPIKISPMRDLLKKNAYLDHDQG